MKTSRVLAVAIVLVSTGLFVASRSSAETCRYFCGTTIRQSSAAHCCAATFQCPDGTIVHAFGYNPGTGWRFCGASAAAESGLCEAGAASLPDWAPSAAAVPAKAEVEPPVARLEDSTANR